MRPTSSLPPAYFENMFAADHDPWNLQTCEYEKAKFARTIEALGQRHYSHALEIGCAQGELTQCLAGHADRVLATDVSETALARARNKCTHLENIRFEQQAFPADAPQDVQFDLILLSEVAYYWADHDLITAGHQLKRLLRPRGDLLLVHWTGVTDYPQTGDGATKALFRTLQNEVDIVIAQRAVEYRLDLWRRRDS